MVDGFKWIPRRPAGAGLGLWFHSGACSVFCGLCHLKTSLQASLGLSREKALEDGGRA